MLASIGISTTTITSENFISKTWDGTLNWDDDVGATITNQFLCWMEALKDLSQLHIPRLVTSVVTFKPKIFKLHSFVDASEKTKEQPYMPHQFGTLPGVVACS